MQSKHPVIQESAERGAALTGKKVSLLTNSEAKRHRVGKQSPGKFVSGAAAGSPFKSASGKSYQKATTGAAKNNQPHYSSSNRNNANEFNILATTALRNNAQGVSGNASALSHYTALNLMNSPKTTSLNEKHMLQISQTYNVTGKHSSHNQSQHQP